MPKKVFSDELNEPLTKRICNEEQKLGEVQKEEKEPARTLETSF